MKIILGDHAACAHAPDCSGIAHSLHDTLSHRRYEWPASILRLDDFGSWLDAHRTARKRAARAARLGYTFSLIERSDHVDEIFAINTSAPARQGRPMSPAYMQRPSFSPLPGYPCVRHRISTYGVFSPRGMLVAYIVPYVAGEVALISQILGHAAHLENDVMYLLVQGAFADTVERSGPVIAFYNMHDSGTEGLRYFKERLGFQPHRVIWEIA